MKTNLASVYSLMMVGFAAMMIPFFVPVLQVTSIGAIVGTVIALFALVIAINFTPDCIARVLFVLTGLVMGMFISTTVLKFAATSFSTVVLAGALTAVMFFCLTIYALTTKRDFTSMGGYLFIALLVLVVASLLCMFLAIPIINTILAYVGVIIFSACMIYDTQMIVRGNYTVAQGALALFLNIVNIFLRLLDILE